MAGRLAVLVLIGAFAPLLAACAGVEPALRPTPGEIPGAGPSAPAAAASQESGSHSTAELTSAANPSSSSSGAADFPTPVPTPDAVSTAAPDAPTHTPGPGSASDGSTATSTPTAIPATATLTPIPFTPTPTATFPPFTRQTQFVPLYDPEFVAASQPSGLTDSSYVLGLTWNGEARAYPLSMVWWHHIVNDTVGGDPVLVTF